MSTGSTPTTTPNAATALERRVSLDSPGAEARHQVAWQREMERAQMATWFKPPVAARTDRATQAPSASPPPPLRHAPRAVDPQIVASAGNSLPGMATLPGPAYVPNLPIAGSPVLEAHASAPIAPAYAFAGLRTAALAEATPETRALTAPQIRRTGGPVQAANEPMPEGATDVPAEATDAPSSSTPQSAEFQAPLRLHEEATPEGQAVWIAMRADDEALAAMLPRIVADLQRDMQQARGERLHQVVCNGRLVWREGTTLTTDGSAFIAGGERRPATVFDSLQSKGA
ncbi:hypothetical protein JVX96_29825 (plasmid) [Variovorax sp. PDNC026]|uniref:hypothetical protein n=1 Tax=Variovorax sp. PDNC026 TaxID=2811425 RepID=UPI001964799C|nr:hypothetical protein [Variovorax sp. PDNC026]QRY35505.1 hypothetical protein JVX96_29825 [Variovorax sp. PDNC026]